MYNNKDMKGKRGDGDTKILKIEKYEDFIGLYDKITTPSVAAIGFFDGVHRGHRMLFSAAREYAKRNDMAFTVFTFTAKSMNTKGGGKLYTDKEKCALLESESADTALLCDLSAVKDLEASEFVSDILFGKLGIRAVFSGCNFKFGRGAAGDTEMLRQVAKKCGGEAFAIPEITDGGDKISSSRIKELIAKADLRGAGRLLGLPYFITGKITHGKGLGKDIGIPTVNIARADGRILPPIGVYSTVTKIRGVNYLSLTNIGTCPTFGEREIHSETFILDFSENVYDEEATVYFIDYLREEKVFDNEKELVMQINIDKNRAKELLGDLKWQEIGQK